MNIINLDQKTQRLKVSSFETENKIVFEFFNKTNVEDRNEQFYKALYIGVLALMEDRLSSFLARTSNELGTELESLKIIFDMKKELFYKSAVKGILAENDICEHLKSMTEKRHLNDDVKLAGNVVGNIEKNKTGDIVSYIDKNDDKRVVIECKFDKSIRLGDIKTKDVFARNSDTAWGQLLEAQANRSGKTAIIVFDRSIVDSSILNVVDNVKYIPNVGFISIIDSQKGDYTNLDIAYSLARDLVLNSTNVTFDADILTILLNRIIKDLIDISSIKSLIVSNIDNCNKILLQIEKSMLTMEFNQRYLSKFLVDGTLSKEDLLKFYAGEEIRDEYKSIEQKYKKTSKEQENKDI